MKFFRRQLAISLAKRRISTWKFSATLFGCKISADSHWSKRCAIFCSCSGYPAKRRKSIESWSILPVNFVPKIPAFSSIQVKKCLLFNQNKKYFIRHLLHPLLRHNHAEHFPLQSQRERAHESGGFPAHHRLVECPASIDYGSYLNFRQKCIFQEIYNSIRSESFKFPDEDANNGSGGHYSAYVFKLAEKQGWLQKQGFLAKNILKIPFVSGSGLSRTWNRRWFVLSNKCLYYFEFPSVSLLEQYLNFPTFSEPRAQRHNPAGERASPRPWRSRS